MVFECESFDLRDAFTLTLLQRSCTTAGLTGGVV